MLIQKNTANIHCMYNKLYYNLQCANRFFFPIDFIVFYRKLENAKSSDKVGRSL